MNIQTHLNPIILWNVNFNIICLFVDLGAQCRDLQKMATNKVKLHALFVIAKDWHLIRSDFHCMATLAKSIENSTYIFMP